MEYPLSDELKVFKKIGQTGIVLNLKESIMSETKFYQTANARETIAIQEDPDGSISIGIARAGRTDIEARRVSSEEGMKIAEGRMRKARTVKEPLIERNYLRGIHALRIK
jgi:hypothetical protein